MQILFFYFFSFFVIFCAVNVILNKNPVKSVLFLILTFIGTAILWLMMEAEFLALTLILVYVGAVMVLFLFVVMMLDITKAIKNRKFGKMLIFGSFLLLLLLIFIVYLYGYFLNIENNINKFINIENNDVYNNVRELGILMYSDFLFAFLLVGVLLLMGIISAITLAFRGTQNRKYQDHSIQMESDSKNIRLSSSK